MKKTIKFLEQSAYALLMALICGLLITGIIGLAMMILALVTGYRP